MNIKSNQPKNFSKDMLFDLFIKQNLSSKSIAVKLECSIPTIKKYLRKHNIRKSREQTNAIISNVLIGKHCSPRTEFKKGHKPSLSARYKMKIARLGKHPWNYNLKIDISKYPKWGKFKGGISYEVYPKEFFEKRLEILKRDCYKCRICGETHKRLDVHHIDWNPGNNSFDNLITLCISCHSSCHRNDGPKNIQKLLSV